MEIKDGKVTVVIQKHWCRPDRSYDQILQESELTNINSVSELDTYLKNLAESSYGNWVQGFFIYGSPKFFKRNARTVTQFFYQHKLSVLCTSQYLNDLVSDFVEDIEKEWEDE